MSFVVVLDVICRDEFCPDELCRSENSTEPLFSRVLSYSPMSEMGVLRVCKYKDVCENLLLTYVKFKYIFKFCFNFVTHPTLLNLHSMLFIIWIRFTEVINCENIES